MKNNNMKNNILKGAFLALLSFSIISCSDFLDVDPHDSMSDAAVWGNLDLAEAFLNNCYTYVEGENEQGVPFCSYTDEMYHRTGYATEVYTLGNVSCDNYNVGFSEARGNTWHFYYSGINKVNQLLENIDEVPTVSDSEDERKSVIIGQAYFLRAFFYHQLYSLYGRVPLVDHTFEIESEWTETRADMDDIANFVVEDCNRAIERLPLKYASSNDFGRATKGAAMAVKARTLLYKASPLFGTPTSAKWEEAAKANKDIIDLGVYSLSPVSNSDEYASIFFNIQNPEIIFEKLYNSKGTYGNALHYLFQAPIGPYNGYYGWGVWVPTYDIVNAYQKADGTEYQVTGLGSYTVSLPTVDPATGQVVFKEAVISATKDKPWNNREMRFYANILYDGALWGYGDDNHAIELFEPGEEGVRAGEQSPSNTDGEYWNATQTGYHMKKFMDPDYDMYNESLANTTPWIFFRLSEIYLNYAECQIELGNNAEALKYINYIRERVHLPAATGANIRAEYEYERKIELMFEGQRFFDLRRWKRMEETYSKENWPTGMKIYKMKDGTLLYHHNENYLQQRRFVSPQMYWMPVPRYELNKCPNLDGQPYED